MAKRKDFVDQIVEERTRANPEFPTLVDAATRARQLVKELAERRQQLGLSQTTVAARMGTSQSALARLEGGESDPRLSTLERYAIAVGKDIALRRPSKTASP